MSKREIQEAVQQAVYSMPPDIHIVRIRLFGSHLHGDATVDSDVDLIVDFDESSRVSLFDLYAIEQLFKKTLRKDVDLTTPEGLHKHIRGRVLKEAEVVYESAR